ncbi:MAG TPA: hypothetical protein VFN11_08855 [Ktedonobacterales bacterium]|nr:hypothetical protein [Ktedonobacterales bacterium]
MLSMIRLIIGTRWARFVVAAVALFCAVGVSASVFATSKVSTKSGTIQHLGTVTSDSGAYKYDTLQFSGDSATYQIDRTKFTPSLGTDQFTVGAAVRIWYTISPLNDPYVIAISFSGASSATPQYVTDFYTHPDDSRTSRLILAGVFVVVAIVAAIAGFTLPAPSRSRKEAAARAKSNNPWYP